MAFYKETKCSLSSKCPLLKCCLSKLVCTVLRWCESKYFENFRNSCLTLNICRVLPFLASVPIKSLLADASFVLITNSTIFALYIASGFKTVNTAEPSRTGAFLQSIAHSTICTGGHARADWTWKKINNLFVLFCLQYWLPWVDFVLSIANTPF